MADDDTDPTHDDADDDADGDADGDDELFDVDEDIETPADPDDEGEDADDEDEPDADADDDGDADADDDGEDRDDDEVAYELADWASETRLVVDGLLTNQGIAHAWQAGTLVVRADDEAAVDQIIDDVEITTLPALDPEAPKLAYEVNGWTDEQRVGLADALGAEGVPYEWDEIGDLVVHEADEAKVEEVLDGIEFPDALDEGIVGDDDGMAAGNALSELFVSSDRLMHDARDHEGVLSLVDTASTAAGLSLPFGFERHVWDEIVSKAQALSARIESDVEDDDEIIEQATALRQLLRAYV